MESDPVWVDVVSAKERVRGMRGKTLLHAGPPINWGRASGPLKGAILGAIMYEGWAENEREATRLVREGEISWNPLTSTTVWVRWPG